jgi:DNA processing protein
MLIRQGARPVENAGDVLEELGLDRLFSVAAPGEPSALLSPEEEAVRNTLSFDPATLDHIVERSGLAAQRALAALTFLEMKGYTRQLPGRLYVSSGKRF